MVNKERKYGVKDVITTFGLKSEYCKDFNPRVSYRKTKATEKLIETDRAHRLIVGRAYQLVLDMSEQKATKKELERAVRYLWVCIDAKQYKLDYWKARLDFGVPDLCRKYGQNGMVI